jgi:hypothetical protein
MPVLQHKPQNPLTVEGACCAHHGRRTETPWQLGVLKEAKALAGRRDPVPCRPKVLGNVEHCQNLGSTNRDLVPCRPKFPGNVEHCPKSWVDKPGNVR